MTVSITNNPSAHIARVNLAQSNERLQLATERISSGKRVNKAADDAAALSVGRRLSAEVETLRTAQINVGSASSMLQIAEGGYTQITDIVTRLRQLAVQAGSGQISDAERSILDVEFQALKNEIDRIAADTEFNGVRPIAGTHDYTQTRGFSPSTVGISNIKFIPGTVTTDSSYRLAYNSGTEVFTLTRIDGGVASSETVDITASLDAKTGAGQNLVAQETLKVTFPTLGVKLTLDSNFARGTAIAPTLGTGGLGADIAITTSTVTNASTNVSLAAVQAVAGLPSASFNTSSGVLTLNLDTNGVSVVASGIAGLRYQVGAGAIGAAGAASGNLVSGGASSLSIYADTTAGNVLLTTINYAAFATTGTTDGTLTVDLGEGLFGQDYTSNTGAYEGTFVMGSGVTDGEDLVEISIGGANTTKLNLTGVGITSLLAAQGAIMAADTALNLINTARSGVGAGQARVDAAAANIVSLIENNIGAEAALIDADISAETTRYAAEAALSQAGIAMLAQANAQPDILLRLLEG